MSAGKADGGRPGRWTARWMAGWRDSGRHAAAILEHEPSWFAEFGSGLALFLWGWGALMTDDLTIRGWQWLLPALALGGGPLRWFLLWRTWYGWRVFAAAVSALLWGWLAVALASRYGALPNGSGLQAWFTMDCLTMARFSLPAMRDIVVEWREPRVER